MAPSKKHQHDLLSKSEIAKALGMTSQTFSNRQSRDDKFPPPTYSNRSGSVALYDTVDAKKVYDYCTRAERERLAKAEQMFASLTSGEVSFEDVELPLEEDEAPASDAAKAEVAKEEAPAPAKEEAPAKDVDAERRAAEKARLDKNEAARLAKADNSSGLTAEKAQTKEEKLAADKAAKGITEPTAAEKAAKEKATADKIAAADAKTAAAAKTAPAKTAAPAKAPAAKGTGAAFGLQK